MYHSQHVYFFSTNAIRYHNDEIWLKVGGDHGGNPSSFKFWVAPLATSTPNSDKSTLCTCIFHGYETRVNLEKTVGDLHAQSINFMQETGHWR